MKKTILTVLLLCFCSALFHYAGDYAQGEKPSWTVQPKQGKKEYHQQSILVKFKKGVLRHQREAVTNLVNGSYKDKNQDGIDDRYHQIMEGRWALIELKGEKGVDLATKAIEALKKHRHVEHAEYNYIQYILKTPNDPRFNELWGMKKIAAENAWNITTGSPDVIVGVIDTGVDYNHQDLASNVWVNPNEIPNNGIDDEGNGYVDDVHGINAITGSGNPMDDNSHGTHCSGTIGAVGNNNIGVVGVNWTVKIAGMKFLSSGGSGTIADAIKCINYAIDLKRRWNQNLRVLSNSWGGGGYSQALHDAISAANDADILFVAAAGNDGQNTDQYPHYPSCYDVPNVLSVAATDPNDGLCSFSNYGAATVDLGAPGSNILSTVPNNSYASKSGTSMATPHVSGAAALLLAVKGGLTVQELKTNLMNSGDPVSALQGKTVSGKRLNAYNSIVNIMPEKKDNAPAPLYGFAPDRMDVFWKATDGSLMDTYWNGQNWQTGKLSSGPLDSAPAPLYGFAPDRMDVFWKATDGSLMDTYWNGQNWQTGKLSSGPLDSAPAPLYGFAPDRMDVFWKATDGSLMDTYWNGQNWQTGKLSSGPLDSAPAPLYGFAQGRMDVFWKATDGSLMDTYWNGQNWQTGKASSGPLDSAPAPLYGFAPDRMDVFWKAADGSLMDTYWNGQNWQTGKPTLKD